MDPNHAPSVSENEWTVSSDPHFSRQGGYNPVPSGRGFRNFRSGNDIAETVHEWLVAHAFTRAASTFASTSAAIEIPARRSFRGNRPPNLVLDNPRRVPGALSGNKMIEPVWNVGRAFMPAAGFQPALYFPAATSNVPSTTSTKFLSSRKINFLLCAAARFSLASGSALSRAL
jgi:hypothetical protein